MIDDARMRIRLQRKGRASPKRLHGPDPVPIASLKRSVRLVDGTQRPTVDRTTDAPGIQPGRLDVRAARHRQIIEAALTEGHAIIQQ